MFGLLLKIGVDTAWYMTSGVWYLGKRIIYGQDVDPSEKALREISRISDKVELEMKELKEIREELKSVREHADWLRTLSIPPTQQYAFLQSQSTTNDANCDKEHNIELDSSQHNTDLNRHTHSTAYPLDAEQPVVVREDSIVPAAIDY